MFLRALPPFLLALTVYPAHGETLRQAISRAVVHFPEIQAASSRQAAAQAQVGQARAEFFPSVNLSLGEGRETSRNISTRTNDVTLTRHEADLSATQLLFDGGAAGGQLRRFRAREEGAGFAVSDTAENAGARAGQTYIDVLRLREQLGVARENVATHDRTLSDVNALAEAGRGRRADVTQADARRALAISAVEQLNGQLNQTESVYKYFTGRLPLDLEAPPSLSPRLPATLEEAVRLATTTHPALRSAEKEFEAAQYDRDSTRARYIVPRVTVEAGSSRNRDIDGIGGPNRDAYAMLRLRYNLFRGFADSERVREAHARIDEAIAGLNRVRNEVERDVRAAWEALASDRARLPALELYARSSTDVAEAYRLQFQLAQRSLLDVLNAENERFNAISGLIAGRSAVAVGEIRLLASMGGLLQSLGIAASGAADDAASPTPAPPADEAPVETRPEAAPVLHEPPAAPLRPTVMPPAREAVRVDYRVPERRAASLERLDLRLESRLRNVGTVELSGLERTR
ncbi:MAG TPA: TolC family outer membrane protein [Burkholderiales bacterium]|nr:TolC family outer membrane protein [Burkholderiales bacterium]